jgi:hypothetical protein
MGGREWALTPLAVATSSRAPIRAPHRIVEKYRSTALAEESLESGL